ncbi:MAG: hypothetical protein CMJ39_00340 [Phycisphaerae bacterium]|nr:hypothetical protein [Phycisphaerae bacterium]|tara:strand:+ start:514 stop:678 length:165 start_codon:yes stop_codon:yes gene_type:complete
MNPAKQYKKLVKLNKRAELCLSREEAQLLIRKADKAYRKLDKKVNRMTLAKWTS